MYVDVCMCIHACICVFIYVWMCVCECLFTQVYPTLILGTAHNSEGTQVRRFSITKVLNYEGSQIRRVSSPKGLKSENQYNDYMCALKPVTVTMRH